MMTNTKSVVRENLCSVYHSIHSNEKVSITRNVCVCAVVHTCMSNMGTMFYRIFETATNSDTPVYVVCFQPMIDSRALGRRRCAFACSYIFILSLFGYFFSHLELD